MIRRMQWRYDLDSQRIYKGGEAVFAVCVEIPNNDISRKVDSMACDAVAALNELHADRVEADKVLMRQALEALRKAVVALAPVEHDIGGAYDAADAAIEALRERLNPDTKEGT